MNWIKKNPLLTALLALTVVVLAAGGYVLSQQQAAYAAATEALTTQVAEANRLQALKPYPDKQNLDKAIAEKDKYRDSVNGLQNELLNCNVPQTDISPADFGSKLREINAANTQLAHDKHVLLPQDFYMGFPAYSQKLPEAKASSGLNRQLDVINEVVKLLLDKSITEIRSIERVPLPQEDPKGEAPPQDLVSKTRFTITFRADNNKTKDILNTITRTIKPYLVIRNVEMQNDIVDTIARGQANGQPAAAAAVPDGSVATAPATQVTVVLVGGEKVTTTLEIDVLSFGKSTPPSAQGNKPEKGTKPKN